MRIEDLICRYVYRCRPEDSLESMAGRRIGAMAARPDIRL